MKTITITVTQHDIECGAPREPTACPVALAVGRVANDPFVGVIWLYCSLGRFRLTLAINKFIRDFDGGQVVHPRRFHLRDLEK